MTVNRLSWDPSLTEMYLVPLQMRSAAQSNRRKPTKMSLQNADSDRLIAIAQANIAEVAAGKMALEKSSNADRRAP